MKLFAFLKIDKNSPHFSLLLAWQKWPLILILKNSKISTQTTTAAKNKGEVVVEKYDESLQNCCGLSQLFKSLVGSGMHY